MNMDYDIIIKNSINYPIKYSVIIPTHNSENYVNSIINDILCQTNKNFELIIVDDCSIDNTIDIIIDILKNYKDLNYNIIKTKTNIKAGMARNIGINVSSGEYIIFIDSDDNIDHLLIDKLDNINAENYDIVFYGFTEQYIKNGNVIFSKNIYYKNELADKLIDKKEFDNNLYYFENITALGYIWNKCYKKYIIDKFNIRFEDKVLYEDLFFNLNYLQYAMDIYILNKVLYIYNNRIDSKSITKSDDYNYFDLSNEKIKRLKDYININHIDNLYTTDMINRLSKRYLLSYIVRQFESKNYLLKNSKYSINIFEYIYCIIIYLIKKYFYLFYLKLAK